MLNYKNAYLRILGHILLIVLLTAITQIGGLIYLLSIIAFQRTNRLKRIGGFVALYLVFTFLIVPITAPLFGREKIRNDEFIHPQSILYVLANRNYVKPELNVLLSEIAKKLNAKTTGIKVVYLDANFPFIDGFPLLPHLSHNDGKKLDITFIYQKKEGLTTNLKRSRSGYGVYEEALTNEINQTSTCVNSGFWQYSFSKYLSFGEVNQGIVLDEEHTAFLAEAIVKEQSIGKLFIEPHLKTRLKLSSSKVRFHGCQAVRHDDHIHFQLK